MPNNSHDFCHLRVVFKYLKNQRRFSGFALIRLTFFIRQTLHFIHSCMLQLRDMM